MEKIFKFLTIDDQSLMIESSRRVIVDRGTEFIRQGEDTGRSLYTICSGVARVEVNGVAIEYLGSGSLIGEMGFLERSPASESIFAHTNLGVDVIDAEHLHTLMASVPGFATRFYVSLATMVSKRLRTASQLVANSRPCLQLARPRRVRTGPWLATECPDSVISEVARWCSEIANLSLRMRTGETAGSELAAQVARACDRLHGLLTSATTAYPEDAASIGGHVFRQAFPYFMASRVNEHAYTKPHGYAGDGELLELIRADCEAGYGAFGSAVDRWVLGRPIACALRVRGRWIMQSLREFVQQWKGGTPVPVTCLMTGTAVDVSILLGYERALDVTCLEMDSKALQDAARRCGGERGEVQIGFLEASNMLAIGRGSSHTFLRPQKAIIAPDILNRYDDDSAAVQMLDWVYEHLRPDGAVIMGQLCPDHPDRAYLEHILEWHYRYRDQQDLERLFAASRFKNDALTIERHEDGMQLKVICRRECRV
jgi:CRP-like cAMP-binding protein